MSLVQQSMIVIAALSYVNIHEALRLAGRVAIAYFVTGACSFTVSFIIAIIIKPGKNADKENLIVASTGKIVITTLDTFLDLLR